jgi:tetratricopeptide (TPR) repeat protein
LGKYDLALEFATKALDINPKDACSICTLAEAYEYKKELDIAKELFEKVLEIDPTFEDAIEGLKRIKYSDIMLSSSNHIIF